MKLIQIVLAVALLLLSACAKLSEREKLLNHCRKVYQSQNRKFRKADGPQVELTAASGSRLKQVEPLLKLAADYRLRSHPEESQQIQAELQALERRTDAIENASREGTGSMESMLRYTSIANLLIRQVEIFLASDEDHARWQRIKSASGEIQKSAFAMENGLANLKVNLDNEDHTQEAELQPWLCFSFHGSDYAFLFLDSPQGINSEFRFAYLMRIRNGKMEIVEELPLLNVVSWKLTDDELVIRGNERYKENLQKVSIKLKRL